MLVRDKRMLATGYNGAPRGTAHCLDIGCLREQLGIPSGERQELCRAIHAEQNAIIQAAVHGVAIEGATLYTTLHPCILCAKMLINCGVQGDPLPRGLPGRALARHARRGRRHAHQGGPAIDGLISLSSSSRTAVLGFVLAAAIVLLATPLMGVAGAARRRRRPPHRRAAHAPAGDAAARRARHLRRVAASRCCSSCTSRVRSGAIIAGATIVVAVGLFDDLFELEPIIKFTGQLLAIAVALYFEVRITRVAVPFVDEFIQFPGVFSLLVTVALDGGDHQHGQLHRRPRRARRRRVRHRRRHLRRDLDLDGLLRPRHPRRRPRRGDVRLSALQLPPGEHLHGRRRIDAARLRARRDQRAERDEGHRRRRPAAAPAGPRACRSSTSS